MTEVQSTDIDTIDNKSIVIETDLGVTVNTATSTAVELIPDSYVLTSLGIFTGNLDGSIPVWLLNAIQQALTTGDGSIISVLADMQLLLDNLSIGVNQNLTHIETTDLSLAALEASVVSRLNGNDAAILNLDTTKVTATEAQAISAQAIQSTFNNNIDAYIGNISSTYVDANSAIAQDIGLLAANFNDVSVSIATIDQAVAGYYSEWDGVSTAQLGQFKFIGGVQYQFLGGTFGEANDGWVRTDSSAQSTAETKVRTWYQASAPILTASDVGDLWVDTDNNNTTQVWTGTVWANPTTAQGAQATAWAAGASKLITAPDGGVTGWSFADGSNVSSQFKIQADKFIVSSGTSTHTPLVVNTIKNRVEFSGYVSFTGLGIDSLSTAIDGGSIATNTITADRISSGELDITGGGYLGGFITTLGTFGSFVSSSDSLVGTFSIANTFNREVKVVVTASGRTGAVTIPDTSNARTCNFAIFDNNLTNVFEYGWTPMYQDSKSMAFSYTVPASTVITFSVRGRKTDDYELTLILKPVWIGVNN